MLPHKLANSTRLTIFNIYNKIADKQMQSKKYQQKEGMQPFCKKDLFQTEYIATPSIADAQMSMIGDSFFFLIYL